MLHFGARYLAVPKEILKFQNTCPTFLSITPDRHNKPDNSIAGLANLLLLKPFQICGVCVSILLYLNLTFAWSGIAIFSENKIKIFPADYETYILKLVAVVSII